MSTQRLIAGNWKMNGLAAELAEAKALAAALAGEAAATRVALCPPSTLIAQMNWHLKDSAVEFGGQDCSPHASGAYTGDISAAMLKDAGASHVIVGHSERRADHGESSETVRAKAAAAIAAGLTAVVCIGETLAEREAGRTLEVVGGQLEGSIPDGITAASLVVAYEPVWAIGTGLTPTLAQIGEVHDALRAALVARFGEETGTGVRLLYGGSVKPDNAREIFGVANVDGALVGGASLKAKDFGAIIAALDAV